jgi:Family of unknown function (DUF6510)
MDGDPQSGAGAGGGQRVNLADDDAQSLMLDGNAVAGLMIEIFGREMTVVQQRCDHCESQCEMGGLHAYVGGPGVVLRCPSCDSVLMRIVTTPDHYLLDVRGIRYLRLARE